MEKTVNKVIQSRPRLVQTYGEKKIEKFQIRKTNKELRKMYDTNDTNIIEVKHKYRNRYVIRMKKNRLPRKLLETRLGRNRQRGRLRTKQKQLDLERFKKLINKIFYQ